MARSAKTVENPNDALQRIAAAEPKPSAVLVLAAGRARQDRVVASLVKKLSPAKGKVEVRRLHARDLTSAALENLAVDAASVSLFAPTRFFVIVGVDELNAANTSKLLPILNEATPSSTIILVAEELPASHALRKFATKREALIVLPDLEGAALQRWIQKELTDAGVTKADSDVASTIAELAEGSSDEAYRMAQHAALFAGDGPLSSADLGRLFIEKPQANEFALLDALATGNTARCYQLVTAAFNAGKSPFLLLALLNRNFVTYLSIRLLLSEGVPEAEVRSQLKVQPWLFQKQLAAASRYSLEQLRDALAAILRADSLLKNRSLGPEAIFESLVSKLIPSSTAKRKAAS